MIDLIQRRRRIHVLSKIALCKTKRSDHVQLSFLLAYKMLFVWPDMRMKSLNKKVFESQTENASPK